MKNKSIIWWMIFILLCIWQLPQFIVALAMLPFLGKRELVADRHFNFGFKCENMLGGISLGPFAYVSKLGFLMKLMDIQFKVKYLDHYIFL